MALTRHRTKQLLDTAAPDKSGGRKPGHDGWPLQAGVPDNWPLCQRLGLRPVTPDPAVGPRTGGGLTYDRLPTGRVPAGVACIRFVARRRPRIAGVT